MLNFLPKLAGMKCVVPSLVQFCLEASRARSFHPPVLNQPHTSHLTEKKSPAHAPVERPARGHPSQHKGRAEEARAPQNNNG